jgi:hypothetical protein
MKNQKNMAHTFKVGDPVEMIVDCPLARKGTKLTLVSLESGNGIYELSVAYANNPKKMFSVNASEIKLREPEVQKPDPFVEAVRAKMLKRSEVGLSKYGVGLDRPDLSRLDWLRHAQEEAMDLANYLEVLIQEEEIEKNWMPLLLEGVEMERSRDGKTWEAVAVEEPYAGDGYLYRRKP